MDKAREIELLKNASDCFNRCMSPFCEAELIRMGVTSDECGDLSFKLADIVDAHLDLVSDEEKGEKPFWSEYHHEGDTVTELEEDH